MPSHRTLRYTSSSTERDASRVSRRRSAPCFDPVGAARLHPASLRHLQDLLAERPRMEAASGARALEGVTFGRHAHGPGGGDATYLDRAPRMRDVRSIAPRLYPRILACRFLASLSSSTPRPFSPHTLRAAASTVGFKGSRALTTWPRRRVASSARDQAARWPTVSGLVDFASLRAERRSRPMEASSSSSTGPAPLVRQARYRARQRPMRSRRASMGIGASRGGGKTESGTPLGRAVNGSRRGAGTGLGRPAARGERARLPRCGARRRFAGCEGWSNRARGRF